MPRTPGSYEEAAKNFKPAQGPTCASVAAEVRSLQRPSGVPDVAWFYVNSFTSIYSSWGKLAYADLRDNFENLADQFPPITIDVERRLARFCLREVLKSLVNFASLRGFSHEESLRVLRMFSEKLLGMSSEELPEQIEQIVKELKVLLDDTAYRQIETEMRNSSGPRTWRDGEQEKVTDHVLKVEELAGFVLVDQFDLVGTGTALLHKRFGVNAVQFLSNMVGVLHYGYR